MLELCCFESKREPRGWLVLGVDVRSRLPGIRGERCYEGVSRARRRRPHHLVGWRPARPRAIHTQIAHADVGWGPRKQLTRAGESRHAGKRQTKRGEGSATSPGCRWSAPQKHAPTAHTCDAGTVRAKHTRCVPSTHIHKRPEALTHPGSRPRAAEGPQVTSAPARGSTSRPACACDCVCVCLTRTRHDTTCQYTPAPNTARRAAPQAFQQWAGR